MEPGTEVQFVSEGPLGLVDPEISMYKFVADEHAVRGDVGTIVETTYRMAPDNWLLVKHTRTGLYCPVHPSMISPIDHAGV